ncbi:MAG: N-acetylmuramoyl-L-alanine amidase [Alphaproteobacteria bacterium]|nr:N-acetylmuramoyl-L-alanine amidase [Alphaproteobacteria bacterium]
MSFKWIERASPNHDARGEGVQPDILVLHYTGMKTAEAAIARLCDPQARVSAHYTVDEDGTVYAMVPEGRRAWHAGVSYWAGASDINARSIGIEIVNPGHEFGYRPFPARQIESVIALCHAIRGRHAIPDARIVAHSDIAPARKEDPGELFPWARLASEGIGLWPLGPGGDPGQPIAAALSAIGYGVPPHVDWPLEAVIRAFQRRYRTARIDGIADEETTGLARAVAALA